MTAFGSSKDFGRPAGSTLAHLDERCLLAFPQAGEMSGVRSRDEVAATASTPDRWRELQVTIRQLLQPVLEVTVVSYRADVKRTDGQPYVALISSAYVRRVEGWKLAFHQHLPVSVGPSVRRMSDRVE